MSRTSEPRSVCTFGNFSIGNPNSLRHSMKSATSLRKTNVGSIGFAKGIADNRNPSLGHNRLNSDVKLDQDGSNWVTIDRDVIKSHTADFMLDSPARRQPGRGKHRRALDHGAFDRQYFLEYGWQVSEPSLHGFHPVCQRPQFSNPQQSEVHRQNPFTTQDTCKQ